MTQVVNQTMVVPQAAVNPHQKVEQTALFNPDGTPYTVLAPVVTTATAIGTAAKVFTANEPPANSVVPVKFTNGNSAASPTFDFADGSARTVHLGGSAPGAAEITVAADGVVLFWFDGTIFHQFGTVNG